MAMIGAWANYLWKDDLQPLSGLLTLWLSRIESNGYDLREYGRRENEMLQDKDLKLSRVFGLRRKVSKGTWTRPKIYLRGYEYGPEPGDWKVLWSFPEKSYAADFWRLVEGGLQLVPGAWVEDSDDDEVDEWA
jgi:hypothetical protein